MKIIETYLWEGNLQEERSPEKDGNEKSKQPDQYRESIP
jgi:hypothetical protein